MRATHFDDARRMLVELLRRDGDAPILGVDEMTQAQRTFLMVTCSAEILVYILCHAASFNAGTAREGLACLDLHSQIDSICDRGRRH